MLQLRNKGNFLTRFSSTRVEKFVRILKGEITPLFAEESDFESGEGHKSVVFLNMRNQKSYKISRISESFWESRTTVTEQNVFEYREILIVLMGNF